MAGEQRGPPSWWTSFRLRSDIQFDHFLAEQLHCFVCDLDRMDVIERERWKIYYERKANAEKQAGGTTTTTRSF